MTWILGALCALFAAAAAVFAFQARRFRTLQLETDARCLAEIESAKAQLHRIESAGSRTQAEYEELLRACGEAVLVLDSSFTIRQANETAHTVFRDHHGHLIGRTLIQATLSTELSDLAAAALGGVPVEGREVRLPGATGHTLIVSAVAVGDQPGESEECLLVAQDVTELRRLETVRRDFVGNVSHELRTPLASIRAMAETLQDGALNDPSVAGKFLETIVRESDRLTRIAQDLLVLSAAESGPPETDEVNLSALLAHIVEHLRPQAEKAELQLTSSIEDGLMVAGSPDQLQQVFLNLIDNAVKYTRAGGTVEVTAQRRGPMVVTSVKDSGIGILSEHLPRIFERFYRVDKGRSRASGGTGLGLSIVKHISESHGGGVWVESEYNRGSTFTVSLPAYQDPQPALFSESAHKDELMS